MSTKKTKTPNATKAKPRAQRRTQPAAPARPQTKLARVVELLERGQGATLAEMMEATGWQAHSVRGVLAGAIKKKLRHHVVSEKLDGARRYRITPEARA
jgi:hypothetical protein